MERTKKLRVNLLSVSILLLFSMKLFAQNMSTLIPTNTATHTAIQTGSWFDGTTWDTGTIPSNAAIVFIPNGIQVDYEGQSNEHIFAIRVEGTFICKQTNVGQTTTLSFDTFIGMGNSVVKFLASTAGDGSIDITILPFDIEAYKAGNLPYPMIWNSNAQNHFIDGAPVQEVSYQVGPDYRFDSYAEALAGNTSVVETAIGVLDDGPGVLGRYSWDSTQVSLGINVMGELEIIGREKQNMLKLSQDALLGQALIEVATTPIGWEVGDRIIVTHGGNMGALSNGEDERIIQSISGTTITCSSNLQKNHEGRPQDTLHCYVGNLTRNIVFKSGMTNMIHQRGHFMAMFNPTNVQVRNAAFVDMGRTDKSRLTDDFVWNNWLVPSVFTSKISALGQECSEMRLNPAEKITNMRGRYSIHLHKTGAENGVNMVYVTGNVVEGNPGWGITHHDSHATVSSNLVYNVTGAGIVSETGSETGFWDDNLVVNISQGHNTSPYTAALFHDDYLYSGQGLAMKGRAVVCRGNVISNAAAGVGVVNLNPSINNLDRVDSEALATVRPDYQFDQFPLSKNGYSSEGDGVMPVEVALIMENTTVIWCNRGLRSIERDMGLNHESRSVFDGFVAWGVNQGISITYQADYSFKDVFISGKYLTSVGAYLWKHSHNHVFENIKLVDLGHGVTVSKLVETWNGNVKIRNNGFTPWYFIDLVTDNVGEFYQILTDDPNSTFSYTEHSDNPIHLSSSDLTNRPVTFTILDSTGLTVDYGGNDLRFEIDGIITDDLGSYDMGIKQAWAQGTERLDYPERIYEFASQQKLDEYVTQNGVYEDMTTGDLYFKIEELLPNRRTYEYETFPIRVKIQNPPTVGVYASPNIEPLANFEPSLQIISRLATVDQSSTDNSIVYDTASIDASAWKAIDGNNNGRINAQIYQQGLVPVGSFSATNVELEPWYDLDFGEVKEIEFVDLWNTVEINGSDIELVSTHFKDFYVLISDTAFGNLGLADAIALSDYSYLKNDIPTRKFSLDSIGAKGQFLRIQAIGSNKLAFAEVEVVGKRYLPCFNVQAGTDVQSVCNDSFTWIDGNTYTTNNNTAVYDLVDENGCDSTVHLELTIHSIDNSVTNNSPELVANANGITYQWLDCNTMQLLAGETNQNYIATANGEYAVIVTDVHCTDTSACTLVNNLGSEELETDFCLVYPNPASDIINVKSQSLIENLQLTDVFGRVLLVKEGVDSEVVTMKLPKISSGKYFLIVDTINGSFVLPVVIFN